MPPSASLSRSRSARRAPPAGAGPASRGAAEATPRWRRLVRAGAPTAAVLAVLAAVAVAYFPSIDGEFQFDDSTSIVTNIAMKDLSSFVSGVLPQFFGEGRPVTDITFAINYAVAGLWSRPYHETNLAMHLAAVVLAWLVGRALLRRLGCARPGTVALVAAAVWGLHPLDTQAVSYTVQRAEVLAGGLVLCAVLLLLRAEERWPKPSALVAGGLALAVWFVAASSKITAVTAPFAFVLIALAAPRGGEGGPRPLRRTLLLALPLLGAVGVLAARVLSGFRGRADVGFDLAAVPPGSFALTQLRVILRYLLLIFWPAGQNVDYDFPLSRTLLEPATIGAGLVLAGLAAAAVLLYLWSRGRGGTDAGRAARVGAIGIAWFFLMLAPSSSVVPLPDVIMEHRAYLASFGIVLGVVAGATAAARALAARRPAARWLAPALAVAACAAVGTATWYRNQVWESRVALWSDSVAKSPRKARPHFNLAHARSEAGDDEGALAEYRRTLPLAGDGTIRWSDLMRNMGASLLGSHRYDEAIQLLGQASAMDPGNPELHNNLAIAYMEKGNVDKAAVEAAQAIHLWPSYSAAHNTLGETQFMRNMYEAALASFTRAAEFDPDSLPALNNMAVTQDRLGRRAEACQTWVRYGQASGGAMSARAQERRAKLSCP
jgi:tetratricopeptide (TPR) repeat protein